MTKYDSGVLQDYADALYRQASWVALKSATAGAIVGVAPGVLMLLIRGGGVDTASVAAAAPVVQVIGVLVGAVVGFRIGQARAFQYRLQAQTMLCQLQIEYNTRLKSMHADSGA